MKQALFTLVLLLLSIWSMGSAQVFAQSTSSGNNPNPGVAVETLTEETIDSFNPLIQYGDPTIAQDLSTPGGILSRALVFAFPIAGLILFVMLVWSGFEILGGATEKKSLDTGKQRATAAVVGFFMLFVSYWLIQIVEVVFGVRIF